MRSSRRWTTFLALAAIQLLLLLFPAPARGWGERAHGLVTKAAAERVPGDLGKFLGANLEFMVCYSVLPDSWWGSPGLVSRLPHGLENPAGSNGHREQERHHFSADEEVYVEAVGPRGEAAFGSLGRQEALALFEKYVAAKGQEALAQFRQENPWFKGGLPELPRTAFQKAGDLPWVVEDRLADLTAAMKAGQWGRVPFLATVLGHYVGDAHVPLHATINYNGQFHPNPLLKGIHSRWEGRLIELHEAEIASFLREQARAAAPPASVETQPEPIRAAIFRALFRSFALSDEVLRVDDEVLRARHPAGAPQGVAPEGVSDPAIYDAAYYAALQEKLGPGLRQRLWESVEATALFWRVAWERAGRPRPPAGAVAGAPPLMVIDWKNERIVPYEPRHGPRN